jgi:hypothetical protein
MRPQDRKLAQQLETSLVSFDQKERPLFGIQNSLRRAVFLEQLLESIHRVKYIAVIGEREIDEGRADPNNDLFDPLKAAILHQRQGNIDEAFWMVFLFVHFGKHRRAGWRYAREIYGRLGDGLLWNWESTSTNPSGFREWLDFHQEELKRKDGPRGFGNHRKYESLEAYTSKGTGSVVESYVRWVDPPRTHQNLIDQSYEQSHCDPRRTFDNLYQSMQAVAQFGRMARFDYLTMIGKLGLANIEPGSVYLRNSTGPLAGARLLFGGDTMADFSAQDLDNWLVKLEDRLRVGMQVLEDALCNWQKSPDKFKAFRG